MVSIWSLYNIHIETLGYAWISDEGARMAKVKNNPVVEGISGSVGGMVFRQLPGGETWVSGKPDFSRRKFSEGQKNHQSRFKEAVAYAREAAKTHPIYAQLAAGTVKSPYNWALSDWFNPPVIHTIERKDKLIRVEASDNVMVKKVQVTILDAEGKVLEQGEAIQIKGSEWWEYASLKEGNAVAEAWDLAGNGVKKEG
jgi:hypothetical protein